MKFYVSTFVLMVTGVWSQIAPAPSTGQQCISVANSIASVSPTYAAALLQNADAIGLQAYQLAQPQPGVAIQKTFLVPNETNFANFYIFLHRRYSLQGAAAILQRIIALQTLPKLYTAAEMNLPGTFETNLTGNSLNRTSSSLVGPCAPGNFQNIGYEKCFANITAPDVPACQSIVHGISNVLPPPYWLTTETGGLAQALSTNESRAPVFTPACAAGGNRPPCAPRRPDMEVETQPPICDATCSVTSCCRD